MTKNLALPIFYILYTWPPEFWQLQKYNLRPLFDNSVKDSIIILAVDASNPKYK